MKQAPTTRVKEGLGDELEPSAVELLSSVHAGATLPFSGRLDQLDQSWAELRARNFEFVPSVVACRPVVEIELDHSFRQQCPICTPVKGGRRYYPDAGQFHLATIQQAKNVHEFRTRWHPIRCKRAIPPIRRLRSIPRAHFT